MTPYLFRSILGFSALALLGSACHRAELEFPASAGGAGGTAPTPGGQAAGTGDPAAAGGAGDEAQAVGAAGSARSGGARGEAGDQAVGGEAGEQASGGHAGDQASGGHAGDQASGGHAGDQASGGHAGAGVDAAPPRVLSFSPGASERGVLKDANVVIRFSEPMNQASTEQALVTSLGSAARATWSSDGTELTLDPEQDFEYATGSTPLTTAPLQYSFGVGSGAQDLAGNTLDHALMNTFYTARELALNMSQVDALVGYVIASSSPYATGYVQPEAGDAADAPVRGFVSFDFQRLPVEVKAVTKATLSVTQSRSTGSPFSLGNLELDHVSFSALALPAFNAQANPGYGVLFSSLTPVAASQDVTSAVQADFAAQALNSARSQFRFAFSSATNSDAVSDTVDFYPVNLRVWYLIP